jgi:hypothetical protein
MAGAADAILQQKRCGITTAGMLANSSAAIPVLYRIIFAWTLNGSGEP